VSVAGYLNLQADPFDSASGDGADSEVTCAVTFGLDSVDIDTYAVGLGAGDVLGGSVSGSGTILSVLEVYRPGPQSTRAVPTLFLDSTASG
jgi:hypothetical protein